MKTSDYLVQYLEKITDSVFLLSGGWIMHIVDSLRKSKLDVYCCHHEQAATIAAEGYARMKNDIGVVVVTSGPGATNAITGVAGARLDRIPLLVISGQQKDLSIIEMVKPITKYAVTIEKTSQIRPELEKAVRLAKSGRTGPVWLEIPLDVQGAEVLPIKMIVEELKEAKAPLMLIGNGIRLAGGIEILHKVINKLKIPVVSAIFTADDIVTSEYPGYLGCQGIEGVSKANMAIDNCDLLLVVGTELLTNQTSYNRENFATQAKIIVIPVDYDTKYFLEELYNEIS